MGSAPYCAAAAAWPMYSVLCSVLCTYIQSTLPHLARSNAGKCSAPGRPVPASCLATRASKPSRFCSLLPLTCITHLQPGELVQVRPDRCAGMLERMRACVRLASRTRFGVAHAHGICTNAPLSSQKGGGAGNCPPAFFQRHYQRLDVAKLSARRGRFAGPARLPE